jgi:hypothetical protein
VRSARETVRGKKACREISTWRKRYHSAIATPRAKLLVGSLLGPALDARASWRVECFDGLAAAVLSSFSAGVLSAGARGCITAFVVGTLCAVVPSRCAVAPGGLPGMLRAIVFGVHSTFVLGAFSAGARGCVSALVIGALRAVDPGLCTAARGGFPTGLPSSFSATLLDDLFVGLVVFCERQRWQRHQHKRGPDCDPSNSNHRNLLQEMKLRAAGGCQSHLRNRRLTQ